MHKGSDIGSDTDDRVLVAPTEPTPSASVTPSVTISHVAAPPVARPNVAPQGPAGAPPTGPMPLIGHADAVVSTVSLRRMNGSTQICRVPSRPGGVGGALSTAWNLRILRVIDRVQEGGITPRQSHFDGTSAVETLGYWLPPDPAQHGEAAELRISLAADNSVLEVTVTMNQVTGGMRFGAESVAGDEPSISWDDLHWLGRSLLGPRLPAFVLNAPPSWMQQPRYWTRSTDGERRFHINETVRRPQGDDRPWRVQLDFQTEGGASTLWQAIRQSPDEVGFSGFERRPRVAPRRPISVSGDSSQADSLGRRARSQSPPSESSSSSTSRQRLDDGSVLQRWHPPLVPTVTHDGFMSQQAYLALIPARHGPLPLGDVIALGSALGFAVPARTLEPYTESPDRGMTITEIERALGQVWTLQVTTLAIDAGQGGDAVRGRVDTLLATPALDRGVVRFHCVDTVGTMRVESVGYLSMERVEDGWRFSDSKTGRRMTFPADGVGLSLRRLYEGGPPGRQALELCVFDSTQEPFASLLWTYQAQALEFCHGTERVRRSRPAPVQQRRTSEFTDLDALQRRLETPPPHGFALAFRTDLGEGRTARRWFKVLPTRTSWEVGEHGVGWRALATGKTLPDFVAEVWAAGGRVGPVRLVVYEAAAQDSTPDSLYFGPPALFTLMGHKGSTTHNVRFFSAAMLAVMRQPEFSRFVDAFGGSGHVSMWLAVQERNPARIVLNENDEYRSSAPEQADLDPDAVKHELVALGERLKLALFQALHEGAQGLDRDGLADWVAQRDGGAAAAAMGRQEKDALLATTVRQWSAEVRIDNDDLPAYNAALKAFLVREIDTHWAPGTPVPRTPRTAAQYLLTQYNSMPAGASKKIQRVVTPDNEVVIRFGSTPVMAMAGKSNDRRRDGAAGLEVDQAIRQISDAVDASASALQKAVVTRANGWELRAVRGQLLDIDPCYWLGPGQTPSNQGYGPEWLPEHTQNGFLQKVVQDVLPSWRDGAWIRLFNRYSAHLQQQLRAMGWNVSDSFQSHGRSNTHELMAINFDIDHGATVRPLLGQDPERPIAAPEDAETG